MTRVIFRKCKKYGEIIALFPDCINQYTNNVMAYMHLGQHFECDYNYVVQTSYLATENEYIPLYEELKSIGYDDLKIVKRNNK